MPNIPTIASCMAHVISINHYSLFLNLTVDKDEEKSTDGDNCGSQIIGIAILLVLLVVAVVCIVGLVIWNVMSHKKLAQAKSKKM